jgi:hypothetical protein
MEKPQGESLSPEFEATVKIMDKAIEVAHKLGDNAHSFAKEIYDLSESCLMAHSIRAVQSYLEENGKGRHWISLTPSKSGQLLPRRAFAMIKPQETDIIVNMTVELEHRRRGVAHELAHLLFVKFSNTRPPSLGRIDIATEGACSTFEKDLCKRHHNFYSIEANLKKLLFTSLSEHSVPA